MRDTPQISSTCFTTNTTALEGLNQAWASNDFISNQSSTDWLDQVAQAQAAQQYSLLNQQNQHKGGQPMATSVTRRLVQVIIVDPNDNIPLDQCLLYNGIPKLTDATDQELFYEIEIKDLLAKHNEKRVKIVDKKVKERTEHLEPAKIRDLKMVVVTIASF